MLVKYFVRETVYRFYLRFGKQPLHLQSREKYIVVDIEIRLACLFWTAENPLKRADIPRKMFSGTDDFSRVPFVLHHAERGEFI